MDSDRVGLGVIERVAEGLTDSEPDRLGVKDRVVEGLMDSEPDRLGVMDELPVSDPVGLCVTDRVEEGLGLTDSEGVWDCVLEGEGGTRTYERA